MNPPKTKGTKLYYKILYKIISNKVQKYDPQLLFLLPSYCVKYSAD